MYNPIQFLIVDDDETLVKVFERLAKNHQWNYRVARTGQEALELFHSLPVEVAVLDINLPGFSGVQILEEVKANNIQTEIIMITGVGTVETAIRAIKLGAYDYLTKPFDDIEKVANLIEKAKERYDLVKKIRKLERQGHTDRQQFEGIYGKSRKLQEIFDIIESVAPTNSTVLILGESGTGKELVARALHRRGNRSDKPFVAINCAAIPEHLIESELFGHKKGSFTGAVNDKRGLFEEADGGTIFLDEIGELPIATQVKLLRVLQEGEIRAVGGNQTKHVDARLITATNKNLEQLMKSGGFREDLYYRLNVISVSMPPLRERFEDIPLLAYHFLKKHSDRLNKKVEKISIDALQGLQSYKWVGNVRELENVIERAAVLASEDTITVHELPPHILGTSFYLSPGGEETRDLTGLPYQDAKDRAVAAFNRSYITTLLRQTHGNISTASEKAGMDRSNFKKIIKKYQIDPEQFKGGGS